MHAAQQKKRLSTPGVKAMMHVKYAWAQSLPIYVEVWGGGVISGVLVTTEWLKTSRSVANSTRVALQGPLFHPSLTTNH
ncbi:hypothetical protein TNCV_5074311 [Trichonephila clavipes]|nr:hypothetical protein TNCV_5074311 [Trichonephila clavipes]